MALTWDTDYFSFPIISGGATMGQKGAIAPLFFLLKY
jgi:hypothetical protein